MKPQKYRAESRIEGQIALILMKADVTGPEIDECLNWAFGPGILYRPIYPDWLDQWRKLHPEYPVRKDYSFVKWIYVVGWLFRKWKEAQLKEQQKFKNIN